MTTTRYRDKGTHTGTSRESDALFMQGLDQAQTQTSKLGTYLEEPHVRYQCKNRCMPVNGLTTRRGPQPLRLRQGGAVQVAMHTQKMTEIRARGGYKQAL